MRSRLLTLPALLGLLTSLVLATPAQAVTEPGYAALGDSVAVGFGATPVDLFAGCDDPGGSYPDVVPSAMAYPNLLAGDPAAVKLVACSSATIADVRVGQVPLVPASATRVTLTVGANDLDYADVLLQCAAGSCPDAADVARTIAAVPSKLAKLVTAIHARAPRAKIWITGYPLLFQPKVSLAKGKLVATCTPLPLVDAKLLVTVDAAVAALNTAIAATAKASDLRPGYNVKFVGVAASFQGHGLCQGASSWLNAPFLADGSVNPVGLHPNASGQRAYAVSITAAGFTA